MILVIPICGRLSWMHDKILIDIILSMFCRAYVHYLFTLPYIKLHAIWTDVRLRMTTISATLLVGIKRKSKSKSGDKMVTLWQSRSNSDLDSFYIMAWKRFFSQCWIFRRADVKFWPLCWASFPCNIRTQFHWQWHSNSMVCICNPSVQRTRLRGFIGDWLPISNL